MRKFCKDCNHEPVCGSPHTEHTLGCDYWQKETVDAVEVVRCRECKWFKPYQKPVEDFDGRCVVHMCETDEPEFCSIGRRRDDG